MQKTEHYQLNQYEPQDSFLRTNFNEDNQRIDEALQGLQTGKCEVIFGSYTGDGAATNDINLGFRPKAVFVTDNSGQFSDSGGSRYGGIVLDGLPALFGSSGNHMLVTATGFRVYRWSGYNSSAVNRLNQTYYYLALKCD